MAPVAPELHRVPAVAPVNRAGQVWSRDPFVTVLVLRAPRIALMGSMLFHPVLVLEARDPSYEVGRLMEWGEEKWGEAWSWDEGVHGSSRVA